LTRVRAIGWVVQVQDVVNPIMAKVYQGAGGPAPGGDSDDLGDHDEL
jgi:hypothetical protein